MKHFLKKLIKSLKIFTKSLSVISHGMDKIHVKFMFRAAVCESSYLRVCYVYSEYLDVCC